MKVERVQTAHWLLLSWALPAMLVAAFGLFAPDTKTNRPGSGANHEALGTATYQLKQGQSLWSVATFLLEMEGVRNPQEKGQLVTNDYVNGVTDAVRRIVIESQRRGFLPLGFDPWGPSRFTLPVGQHLAITIGGTQKADSGEKPKPTASFICPTRSMNSLAQELFNAANNERMQQDLPELAVSDCATYVAQIRSEDLAANSYFSHTSPKGETAFSLMDHYNVPYGWAGENLARNNYPSNKAAAVAISDLMKSPGHRANILSTTYTSMGVGYAAGRNGMRYFTMVLIGPP
ncbi:MAG: CAP domain-containing protein [Candidatus Woykebacteria bacterium]